MKKDIKKLIIICVGLLCAISIQAKIIKIVNNTDNYWFKITPGYVDFNQKCITQIIPDGAYITPHNVAIFKINFGFDSDCIKENYPHAVFYLDTIINNNNYRLGDVEVTFYHQYINGAYQDYDNDPFAWVLMDNHSDIKTDKFTIDVNESYGFTINDLKTNKNLIK